MKKTVVSAAMLLALGLPSAAGAVQMHGVVMGTLTSFSDTGTDKAWSDLAVNDSVRFDLRFDSGLISGYVDGDVSQKFRKDFSPDVTVAATVNGVTRQISSQSRWEFGDSVMGKSMTSMDKYDSTYINVIESNKPARMFTLNLTFADGSIPLLKEIMLGKSIFSDVRSSQLEMLPSKSSSHFNYLAAVDGKSYESILFYKPTSFAIAPVPEPETWVMMLLGLGVVGYAARRRAAH